MVYMVVVKHGKGCARYGKASTRSVTLRCSPHSVESSTSSFRALVTESSKPGLRRFCGHFLDAATARSMTWWLAPHRRGCVGIAGGVPVMARRVRAV